jgi:hypothetical protein
MQKWITTCCLVIACAFVSGCASSHHNYQEVDDVYVTEQDRASERAEQMATEEQERIALGGTYPDANQGEVDENGNPAEDVMTPAERAQQQRSQERIAKRNNRSNTAQALIYVLGGLLEIAFNILLIWLFY